MQLPGAKILGLVVWREGLGRKFTSNKVADALAEHSPASYPGASRDFRRLAQGIMWRAQNAKRATSSPGSSRRSKWRLGEDPGQQKAKLLEILIASNWQWVF